MGVEYKLALAAKGDEEVPLMNRLVLAVLVIVLVLVLGNKTDDVDDESSMSPCNVMVLLWTVNDKLNSIANNRVACF